MLTFHFEPDPAAACVAIAQRLSRELTTHQSVLWLLSGGSNIGLEVQILRQLPADLQARLQCLLVDERFGMPGHADSNWQQLADAGFMDGTINVAAVLQPGLTLDDTRQRYEAVISASLQRADSVVCQLGIGGDGHIAGFLPRSAGLTEDRLVASYDGGNYQRITLTPAALRQAQVSYALAYGPTKRDIVRRLHDETLPVADQPAQLLKQLPEAHVYTDQPYSTASKEETT